jgi:hypothetical protein
MGKLDPNTIIGIVQGKLGDLVFVRMKNGKVYVRHTPVREAPFTAGEEASKSDFKRAGEYVKASRQQPEQYAPYEAAARVTGKRACDLANADFRRAPAIQDIDLSGYSGRVGESIGIQAVDDFRVEAVLITLALLNGTLLEHGAAVLDKATLRWVYVTQVAVAGGQTVVVHVTATDRAGNTVTKTVDHAL